eukprot:jgi/Chlat1/1166/Chrsp112S01630
MARALAFLFLFLASSAPLSGVLAADPDPIVDFPNPDAPVATSFNGSPEVLGPGGKIQPLIVRTFPGLQGMQLSMALQTFEPCSQIPPHSHPRGSEVYYVISGQVTATLIDTSLKVRINTLRAGDVALNPRGLVHSLTNFDTEKSAVVLATFSSEFPGVQLALESLYRTPLDILQFSLGLSVHKLEKLNSTLDLPVGSFRKGDHHACLHAQKSYPPTFPNGYVY